MHTADRRGFTDHFEETLLALLMGAMTSITFANVIARYVFNSNILWALEATVYLFAWMVLLGASYCVKINAHMGVDIVANLFGPGARKALTTFAALCCIIFTGLLFVGCWNYWGPFANVPPIPNIYNDWIATPLGLGEIKNNWRDQAWYEVDSVPMVDWLRFIEPIFNEGERYNYIPRFIPYMVLPLSMALLLFRFLQATRRVIRDEQTLLIASHEAEDQIDDAAARAAGEKV